ncbi:MAG: FAD-binding oxidoreductase [Rhodobacteraceae bacterium]|nr:FAD-binding oxidoreductase [Paracoccaceae bacterium]
MNLLFANDQPGEYPESWYAATAKPPDPFPALEGEAKADICIVGGGYTGLSTALHLAERGFDVALVEAHRVGFGASGRNGGQLGSGQRLDPETLERWLGQDHAADLWRLAEEGKALVKSLIAKHGIDCALRPGVAQAGYSEAEVRELHDHARHLQDAFGYGQIEVLDRDGMQALCPSPAYVGGLIDHGAAHLHPLRYAFGLAWAASGAGARIFERSVVERIDEGPEITVHTANGRLRARHLILACNGYLGTLQQRVATRVMPINNFIVATEPLGDRAQEVLTRDVALADTKFVVNYFRLSEDKRLLFGGGESYGYRFPSDIEQVVRRPMARVFPHLNDVRVDYAWGGTLAITMRRMPYLARLAPNILSASGYSGHGVGTATHAGQLMAEAVAGNAEGFDTMARVPAMPFPGGPKFRSPLLVLAMTWYALRDKLGR